MVTTAAMAVTVYSGVLAFIGAVLLLAARTRPRLRRAGARVMTIFGIFALASLYVWVELGPEIDGKLVSSSYPRLPPAPRAFDV